MSSAPREPLAVRLEREIPATPHQVYRAWLEPDLLVRWMSPGGFQTARAEVDERVGGHYRIWHTADGADAGGFECELLELVPDQRIVLRLGFVGPERTAGPVYDSQLTITLRETAPGRTALRLVHEQLDKLQADRPEVAGGVSPGWTVALDHLATLLS